VRGRPGRRSRRGRRAAGRPRRARPGRAPAALRADRRTAARGRRCQGPARGVHTPRPGTEQRGDRAGRPGTGGLDRRRNGPAPGLPGRPPAQRRPTARGRRAGRLPRARRSDPRRTRPPRGRPVDSHPVAVRLAVLAGLRLGQGAPGLLPPPGVHRRAGRHGQGAQREAGMTIQVTPQRLGTLLRPRSVALVGAADKSGFSLMTYRNLVDFGLGEHTYRVNRRGAADHGRATVTSCTQIAEPVDLAFMMVPRAATLDALTDAAAAGIRHALVLSSGYADAGAAGQRAQADLVAHAEALGVLLVGPNHLGFANFVDQVPVTAIPGLPRAAGPV